jgi:hypothetical protein
MTDTSSSDAAAIGSLIGGFVFCYVLFILLLVAAMVFIYYKIFQKTGNSGWMGLLMLVPIVNIGMFLYLAFSDWPVARENRDLRARLGYPPTGDLYAAGYGAPYPPQGPPMAPNAPSVPYPGGQPYASPAPQPQPQPAPDPGAPPMQPPAQP